MRLVLEEAGVPYSEPAWEANEKEPGMGFKLVSNFFWHGGNTGFPLRAPPAIQRGDFVLCNVASILSFLGEELGWVGDGSRETRAHIDQVCGSLTGMRLS